MSTIDNHKHGDIDCLIERVTDDMEMFGPTSEEYTKLLDYLERLTKLRDEKTPKPVSRDTIVLVAGNILGILAIVAYEQKHVMTSKALPIFVRSFWKS